MNRNKIKTFFLIIYINLSIIFISQAENAPDDGGGFQLYEDTVPPVPINGNVGFLVLVGFALFSFIIYKQKVANKN